MSMSSQVKLSSFYGAQVARPYLVLDANHEALKDRVDAPSANEPLLAWARKVPFESGGSLTKHSTFKDGKTLRKARTDFDIFKEEQRQDVLAANSSLLTNPDERIFRAAALDYYKNRLTPEERVTYKEKALEERKAVDAANAALGEEDPSFQAFLEKQEAYKKAKGAMLSATKLAQGPLWRATREMKAVHKEQEEKMKKRVGKGLAAKRPRAAAAPKAPRVIVERLDAPKEKSAGPQPRSKAGAAAKRKREEEEKVANEAAAAAAAQIEDSLVSDSSDSESESEEEQLVAPKVAAKAVVNKKKTAAAAAAASSEKRMTRNAALAAEAEVAALLAAAASVRASAGGASKRRNTRRK